MTNTSAMTLAQKSDRILAKTRGLSGATPNATQLIEALRWALDAYKQESERLCNERDEARRIACEALAAGDDDEASEYARLRNWDCFAHTDGASSPGIPDRSREEQQ